MDQIGWQVVNCQRLARGFLARRRMSQLWRFADSYQLDMKDLCVHVGRMSGEAHLNLSRQMDHDSERFTKMVRCGDEWKDCRGH